MDAVSQSQSVNNFDDYVVPKMHLILIRTKGADTFNCCSKMLQSYAQLVQENGILSSYVLQLSLPLFTLEFYK